MPSANNQYHFLVDQVHEHDDYSLVTLRKEDILLIKDWRNAQMDVLRQDRDLSDDDQQHYFTKIVAPTFGQTHPNPILLSYLHGNQCIGYGGLVHIDWPSRRAEVSFLVDPSRAANTKIYRQDFKHFLHLIKYISFVRLKIHRLYTETYNIRPVHISVLEETGFHKEGVLRDHVLIHGRWVDSLIHTCLQEEESC